jgi:hypothetical protein
MNPLRKKSRNWIDQAKSDPHHVVAVAAGLAALVALAGWGRPATVLAQDAPYTEASLQGDYGWLAAYSGDVARLVGTAQFDGKGNLTSGSARVVIAFNTVKSITATGSYTINPDGTGTMTVNIYGVATPPPTVIYDFVITKACVINGIKIATEVQAAQEGPSVVATSESTFVTHVFTRRPNPEEHHRRSTPEAR